MMDGAVAGVSARTCTAPIDLLKIRFQVQRRHQHYKGIISACQEIVKTEGIKVLIRPFSFL